MPALRNMNRSLCRVEVSAGCGVGRFLQTARFSPERGREGDCQNTVGRAIAGMTTSGLLCSAHLLVADRDRSTVSTSETALRGGKDEVADWVLLVEGFSKDVVAEDRSALLRQAGAEVSMTFNLYALDHLVTGVGSCR